MAWWKLKTTSWKNLKLHEKSQIITAWFQVLLLCGAFLIAIYRYNLLEWQSLNDAQLRTVQYVEQLTDTYGQKVAKTHLGKFAKGNYEIYINEAHNSKNNKKPNYELYYKNSICITNFEKLTYNKKIDRETLIKSNRGIILLLGHSGIDNKLASKLYCITLYNQIALFGPALFLTPRIPNDILISAYKKCLKHIPNSYVREEFIDPIQKLAKNHNSLGLSEKQCFKNIEELRAEGLKRSKSKKQ